MRTSPVTRVFRWMKQASWVFFGSTLAAAAGMFRYSTTELRVPIASRPRSSARPIG